MRVIKNKEELQTLLNEYKDLILPGEDVRIEYQVKKGELRNVECGDLLLMDDNHRFDFHGKDFRGTSFHGRDFFGRDFRGKIFHGRDFHGLDFRCLDFYGRNFFGKDFRGGNFFGKDFFGEDFHGLDFHGRNFFGKNFRGWNFHGKSVSYFVFFICYEKMKYESIKGQHPNTLPPISLEGSIEISK